MTDLEQIVTNYRAACEAIQPAWEHMLRTPVGTPERKQAVEAYRGTRERADACRRALLEYALDGRSEVPR